MPLFSQTVSLRLQLLDLGVNEEQEFSEVASAMKAMGFSHDEEKMLLKAIAGILHLGNVHFKADPENSDACQFTESGSEFHQSASDLFGLDPHFFRSALLYKAVRSGKRTSVVYSNYTVALAIENRNALSKELYNRCFNWIVGKINCVLNEKGSEHGGGMIGILGDAYNTLHLCLCLLTLYGDILFS